MSVRAPSTQQIGAQIEDVLHRNPRARLIGIRSPIRRPWPERIERNGANFRLIWCESGLELRERLAEFEETSDGGLVVVTSLDETALGDDLAARFARGRLLQANSWQMVRTAFQAHAVDPRLSGQDWIAELLLDHAPPGGYPPVAGGMLDADTAWRHLLERGIGLTDARPDVGSLLRWTLDGANLGRFAVLPEAMRERIAARLMEVAGPAGGLVVGAVAAGRGADVFPLGLVCGVVFAEQASSSELREAAVRLEPYFGGRRIPRDAGQNLAEAASRVAARLDDPEEAGRYHERAARLLEDLHVAAYAGLSPVLALGFEARLRACAEALHAALDAPDEQRRAAVEAAVGPALAHEQAARRGNRVDRLQMAVRLLRWLATPEVEFRDLAATAGAYAREGGFVDLARLALPDDEIAELAAAYGRLGALAGARRERENRRFAEALRAWNATGGGGDRVLPVEGVLEAVVAPLARQAPVLLIVLDGLSFAVHRRILPGLLREGWIELVPQGRAEPPPVIAALPTVTEVSRASLFSGRLTRGTATSEKVGFAEHPALVQASRANRPPRLFHKAELEDDGALARELREGIANQAQRVVGVVHNAIDAQLAGSDQLHMRWSLDALRLLRPLLREARDAGRIVVLTGDHGHVVESGTTQRSASGGDRWRHASSPVAVEEVELHGGRVLAPDNADALVPTWSETIRYSQKRSGYHGGASPQEVVVPLAVLTAGLAPDGWAEAPPVQPPWWEAGEPAVAAASLAASFRPTGRPRRDRASQPELFPEVSASRRRDWITDLFASATYAAQKRLAARGAPRDEEVRRLLAALDARGGRLSQTALAQALGVPVFRVGTVVIAARRVLNVDQTPVLRLEPGHGTVTLDGELLRVQFELPRG